MSGDANTAFVQETVSRLGWSGSLESFGVARLVVCTVRDRQASVGTNGSYYWVAADVELRGFSPLAAITWAPEPSYDRSKMLQEAPLFGTPVPKPTNDPAFDAIYLVQCLDPDLPPSLTEAARSALVAFANLRPSVKWVTPNLTKRLHIEAQPGLRAGPYVPGPVAQGTHRFRPEEAAMCLERVVVLAEQLEGAWE